MSDDHSWYQFVRVWPGVPIPPDIPESVAPISPRFVEIYKQANAAESHGLSEVCGPGYRKALEVLVKDYLIGKANDLGVSEDEIKDMWLGKCIDDYVQDPMTKAVAKRAAWLGNDESHYTRTWIEKDLDDLKKLFRIFINAIDSEVTAGEYVRTMNPESRSDSGDSDSA